MKWITIQIIKLNRKLPKNESNIRYHYRLIKGAIVLFIDLLFNPKKKRTYMRLFDNESIEFDLSKACPLQMGKDYRARNTVKFTRNAYCPNDKKNVI